MILAHLHGRILYWEQFTESKWLRAGGELRYYAAQDFNPQHRHGRQTSAKLQDIFKDTSVPSTYSSCGPGLHPSHMHTQTSTPFLHLGGGGRSDWRGAEKHCFNPTPLFEIRGSWDLALWVARNQTCFTSSPSQSSCLYCNSSPSPHSGYLDHTESLFPPFTGSPVFSTQIVPGFSLFHVKLTFSPCPVFISHCWENISEVLSVLGLKVSLFVIIESQKAADNSGQICYPKRMDLYLWSLRHCGNQKTSGFGN